MKTKTFRPGLESLEVRAVPASLVWRPEAYHLLGPVGGKYAATKKTSGGSSWLEFVG
jgi:hypothetical protein